MDRSETVQRPTTQKLRACLNCAIIQAVEEFKSKGCPNCPFLHIEEDKNVYSTTSTSFKGTIALFDPRGSWVGKWQRINDYKPGMYAMVVDGVLGEDFIDMVEKEGRVYVNRANSFEIE
jgi:transcription elongation factor SPT4